MSFTKLEFRLFTFNFVYKTLIW